MDYTSAVYYTVVAAAVAVSVCKRARREHAAQSVTGSNPPMHILSRMHDLYKTSMQTSSTVYNDSRASMQHALCTPNIYNQCKAK